MAEQRVGRVPRGLGPVSLLLISALFAHPDPAQALQPLPDDRQQVAAQPHLITPLPVPPWKQQWDQARHLAKGNGPTAALELYQALLAQRPELEQVRWEYARLLAPIEQGTASVVYGVRSLDEQQPIMRLGNRFMTLATNLLYGTRLHDVETCYKMLSREVVDRLDLQSEGFDLETEITAQIVQLGYHIHEVPISYHPRYGQDKKLTPLDGIPTLWALVKYRFKPFTR